MPITHRDPGRVLITGGGSGLGAAIATAVTEAGGTAIVVDRDVSNVSGPASFQLDVSDARATEKAIVEIAESFGGLDGVITAAGIDRPGRLADVPAEAWENVVAVNLMGTVAVARAALPYLIESRGKLVTVASSLAIKAVSDATAYCASKFAVLGFTRALAAELRGQVGVATLIPSGMKTRFFDDRDAQYKPGSDAKLNDPAAVADAVMFILRQPNGSEVRELVICHEEEDSWP